MMYTPNFVFVEGLEVLDGDTYFTVDITLGIFKVLQARAVKHDGDLDEQRRLLKQHARNVLDERLAALLAK